MRQVSVRLSESCPQQLVGIHFYDVSRLPLSPASRSTPMCAKRSKEGFLLWPVVTRSPILATVHTHL